MRRAPASCLAVAAILVPSLADSPVSVVDASRTVGLHVPDIKFITQTLNNGLRVVYAPLDNAPVVHVRVLYHVGSKDERPDRRGFAHLFEHMMFRGSEHVEAEQHMKLVNGVGGSSNAFTGFDQTAYVNTVPANALELALWLEADRMASFRVDDASFVTERSVVNEEYLQRVANPPYGRQSIDFFNLAFDQSHYRWTPIGDMEQLAGASVGELQAFFDTYYVPNNAVLAVAGDFDVEQAKAWVDRYFGWMPAGGVIPRPSPDEPVQTRRRSRTVYAERAPLASLTLAFKTGGWRDQDVVALEVLGNILGSGRSSRMYQALVAGGEAGRPLAQSASAGLSRLEDAGLLYASLFVLPTVKPEEAEAAAMGVIRRIAEEGVTDEELQKAKTQIKLNTLRGRQTADSIAGSLAEAWAFAGDPGYANDRLDRLEAVTAQDVARVAGEYLDEDRLSALTYLPGEGESDPAGDHADDVEGEPPVAPSDEPTFPASHPAGPPVPADVVAATFDTGQVFEVEGMEVVLIRDDRLPLVGMTLLLRNVPAGDALPDEQVGLAALVADLVTRGSAGRTAQQESEQLDASGISLGVGDGGDHTRLSASFPSEATRSAAGFVRDLLAEPNLDPQEFTNLRARAAAGLSQTLADPTRVAARDMDRLLFGDAPAGRNPMPDVVANLTLDEARGYFRRAYAMAEPTLILAGDLTREQAEAFARTLVTARSSETTAESIDASRYDLQPYDRRILLIDNPAGGQAAVRLANRAFTLDSDEKYAGNVAGAILFQGIESRMNRALRAEKGLTYGAGGRFSPQRHVGEFSVGFATRPETVGEAIRTAFEVLQRSAREDVTDAELADGRRRVAGSLVLSGQTVGQLAGLRANLVLNDYPLDYYDTYGDRIADVDTGDIRSVIANYGRPDDLSVVVVAPADRVREQLEAFGEVAVVPMPLSRG
jgi:zinc protease